MRPHAAVAQIDDATQRIQQPGIGIPFVRVGSVLAIAAKSLLNFMGVPSFCLRYCASAPRTKFSSASVFGTHAYALDEGTFCCVDLATGERGWREGRYGFGQHIRVGAQWMLVQAEKGFLTLVKANPAQLEEVSRLEALNSKTWNPPTLAGRWLLVRNDREAVCYEIPAK
mgnify:CR=1 FL=1